VGSAATKSQARPIRPALGLAQALHEHESLAGVLARLRESERRWALVAARLPAELAALARPGPLDDQVWKILVEHAAAGAKLRQHVPLIERVLEEQGLPAVAVKVKVAPRTA
jgi:hypothetical protein